MDEYINGKLIDQARKAQVERAVKELARINVHLATRIMSKELVLYREPAPRYKKDGSRAQQQVNTWADLTPDQATNLAFLLLHAIGHDAADAVFNPLIEVSWGEGNYDI